MAGEERMEPLERLLNLVALLLEARRPLTFEEIQRTLDAYRAENVDSAKRMFERDKDVLREYGVPLELVDTDAWGTEQGYFIDKEAYYLPEIEFTEEELVALFVAAQAGPEDPAVAQGIRKLLYGADGGVLAGLAGGPLASGSDARGTLVLAAAEAAQTHSRIGFGYRTSDGRLSDREVDAYAMVFRGGHWYLVGHDREREDVRAFRLSRFTTEIAVVGPGGTPPEGFRAADHVEAGPYRPSGDRPAEVAFDAEAASRAEQTLSGAERVKELSDGRVVLAVPAADEDVLAGLLLQFGPDAEVLDPASLRQAMIRRLEQVVRA
jgi:proteasome accessory factor B